MSQFKIDSQKPNPGNLVELFTIDTTVIGGNDILYLTPSGFNIVWRGNPYVAIPIRIGGEQEQTQQSPGRPNLSIAADRSTMLINLINAYGDLVGADVTYMFTYSHFLDDGETPNVNEHSPVQRYKIIQKSSFNKNGVSFILSVPMDYPTVQLPRRQILRDPGIDYALFCPGVARIRS